MGLRSKDMRGISAQVGALHASVCTISYAFFSKYLHRGKKNKEQIKTRLKKRKIRVHLSGK